MNIIAVHVYFSLDLLHLNCLFTLEVYYTTVLLIFFFNLTKAFI